MLKSVLRHCSILLLSIVFISCATVPLTGRRQLSLIPDSEINTMSFQEYDQFLKAHKLSQSREQTAMVKRVGERIQNAVERYFAHHNLSHRLRGYHWEFNLVEENQVNAWCMPGGKVVVYTGILPVTQTEAGLAVVMGHEIAHAVANHGNERMSQGLVAMMGSAALDQALKRKSQETRDLFMLAYGVGAQVGVLLPYSRVHESEADRLGLIFMAMAGYDPSEAVGFWKRMSAQKSGSVPEFLSTHPSDEKRIRQIQKALPEAMGYYRN